jgi:hypothetical protein
MTANRTASKQAMTNRAAKGFNTIAAANDICSGVI